MFLSLYLVQKGKNVSTAKSPSAPRAIASPPAKVNGLSSKPKDSKPLASVSRAVDVGAGVAFTPVAAVVVVVVETVVSTGTCFDSRGIWVVGLVGGWVAG